ncbi:hypothetical protein [Lysobacter brunescens]|uniref:Secreted protein n=1 Tax=Lysobacter brunescens TaxID=262323 RepID=A0ABW2Y7N5_9GAMM
MTSPVHGSHPQRRDGDEHRAQDWRASRASRGHALALAAAVAALGAWIWADPAEVRSSAAIDRDADPGVRGARPSRTPDARHAPAAAVVDAHGPQPVEVCGLRDAPLTADGAGGLAALSTSTGSDPLAQTRARLLAALRQDGRARARVAAQLLDRPDTEDPLVWHAWAQATLQSAMAEPDPVALGWAEDACGRLIGTDKGDLGSACRRELIRTRLRIEPDNARHWAALAEEDPAAADEAWQGLLRARRWQDVPQALALVTQQALPADVPGYLRLALAAEVDVRAAALPSPGERFLMTRCVEQAPGRQAECRRLAGMLVAHSDATQALALGLKIGEAAGWPQARLQAVQDELQALASDRVRWRPEASQPLSCRSVDTWLQHLQEMASVGELPALRRRLAQHPAG